MEENFEDEEDVEDIEEKEEKSVKLSWGVRRNIRRAMKEIDKDEKAEDKKDRENEKYEKRCMRLAKKKHWPANMQKQQLCDYIRAFSFLVDNCLDSFEDVICEKIDLLCDEVEKQSISDDAQDKDGNSREAIAENVKTVEKSLSQLRYDLYDLSIELESVADDWDPDGEII